MPKRTETQDTDVEVMPDGSQSESTATALPDTAVAKWVADLADNTLQWVTFAQQKASEGDAEEVQRCLVTINNQIEELQRHAELTQSVMGGLVEAVKTAVAQRDELLEELDHAEQVIAETVDEMQAREEGAYIDGISVGSESLMDDIYEDPSIVEDVVESARDQNTNYLVGQLRRVGNDVAASRIEELHQSAKDSKEQLERVESTAREWYFQLPVETRINAPTLEHEDEEDVRDEDLEGDVFDDEDQDGQVDE